MVENITEITIAACKSYLEIMETGDEELIMRASDTWEKAFDDAWAIVRDKTIPFEVRMKIWEDCIPYMEQVSAKIQMLLIKPGIIN